VVRARQLGGRFAGREGEHRARPVPEDEQVLVVVQALGQAEVLAVEGRGALTIADGQGYVVEGHDSGLRLYAPARPRLLLALGRVELELAQPHGVGRDLDGLVLADELERPVER
jgi:hypothetical protein